ncbi:IS5 family transposase [bacterium]|nr:IS5 family transposase [bacterium]
MRLVITNAIWQELEPRVAAAKRLTAGAKPELSDRRLLEAVLYRLRTGTPWRDLPTEFGDWKAVYQRFKRWRIAGVWDRLFEQLPTAGTMSEVRQLFIDSTIVRAHSQAAGVKKRAAKL